VDSFESVGALNLTFAGAADGVGDNGTPRVVFRGLLEGGQVFYYSASDEKSAANEEKVTDIAAMTFDQIKNLTNAIKATSWIQSNTKIKFLGTTDELRAQGSCMKNFFVGSCKLFNAKIREEAKFSRRRSSFGKSWRAITLAHWSKPLCFDSKPSLVETCVASCHFYLNHSWSLSIRSIAFS
jgi:hypothetical protein